MINEFDKDLKQRLGDASLQETGLSFDKDKLWGKIEKKKAKKRIAFLPWFSHAAAVAAGLAAGIFLFVNKDQPVADPKIVVQQKEVPVIQTVTDTVYIVNNTNSQTQHDYKRLREKQAETQIPATTKQPLLAKETITETNGKGPEPSPAEVIAMTETRKIKVLHLSDMDNENSKPRPALKSNFAFLKKYLKDDIQGENPETFSMIVGKTIFNTKN